MPLTHRQIEIFRAVMGTGQVTQAALRLHTSQPTVSRELARLEQVLGMALFERVRGRLRPTVRAMALLEEVERSFVGLERIAATAQALREFAQGRLSLACLPALSQALLPAATQAFIAGQPEAGLAVTPLESPWLEAWLSEQRVDLGLTERREAPPDTRLATLLEADEVVVLPPAHPLRARRVLQARDFEGQAFISFAPADPYRAQVDALFAAHGVRRRLALETGSAAAVCALVRQGLGLAIVNPLSALDGASQGLVIRRLSERIPYHVALVQPLQRAPHPLRPALEAALRAAAAALQGQLAALLR